MFIDSARDVKAAAAAADVIVVGAGPLGLIAALDLARRGRQVLVLESGQRSNGAAQDLSEAELARPGTHHAPRITVARRFGGGGHLWGGRCVPYDPSDFRARPWLGLSQWPLSSNDLAPYLEPACTYLDAGAPVFHRRLNGRDVDEVDIAVTRLERWTNQPRVNEIHSREINARTNLAVSLGRTVNRLHAGPDGRIAEIGLHGAGPERIPVRGALILAAGGNATAQLLLNEQALEPRLFGGKDGPLGRFYMGHVNGQIADILFDDEELHREIDFFVDEHGSYVRRRLTPTDAAQERHRLPNVAFWPVVPEIYAAEHRSGALSALFLALSVPFVGRRLIAESIRLKHVGPPPPRRARHALNLLRDPLSVAGFVPAFLWNRYGARHRVPGFFLKNPGRLYGLEFHAEHLPNAESRLTLASRTNVAGLRMLSIDFRFSDDDAHGVIRAHRVLDDWLRAHGVGRLAYRAPPEMLADAVHAEAKHGNHQIGTVRIGFGPADGVVDHLGTTFDFSNLHVASTAILPTSSQASPTLAAAQMTLRLTEHLCRDGGV